MEKVMTTVIRGQLTAQVNFKDGRYYAKISKEKKILKELGPFSDQDEAEVEIGTALDTIWRENNGLQGPKLVRR